MSLGTLHRPGLDFVSSGLYTLRQPSIVTDIYIASQHYFIFSCRYCITLILMSTLNERLLIS